MSELLVSALLPGFNERMRDYLKPWERDAMFFLSEQRKLDPKTGINDWITLRVDDFENGKFRYDPIEHDES
jgi:hypothetical protein